MDAFSIVGKMRLEGADKVNNQLKKTRVNTQKLQKALKIAGTVMVGAVMAVGAASLKMAADFDKGMREVNTMMGLNEEQFKSFSKEVQQLARDMGVSAVESANALYQAISAGVPKGNAIEFLQIATKAAIGGVTDTATAVDGLTTVINAFKIPMEDAEHVADVLFTTVKGGKTTFAELAASMFQVAPIAAAAGVKFETVSAALATMTKQGTPTAQATTQLRQAIVSIMKPTAEMSSAIANLGYESGQAMIAELGLAETFNVLRASTGGSDEALMKMLGSVEAGQAVLSLTGKNAQMFADDLEAIGDAAGASEAAFEEMERSVARQMAKLKAKLQDVGISIGNALIPALMKVLATITPIITKFGEWASQHPKLVATILASVAAVGALMIVVGMLLPVLIRTIASLHLVAAAQWAWNIAITANPIGLLIVGITALVAAVVLISGAWRDTTKTMREQLEEQTRLVQEAVDKQRQAILGTTNAKLDALQKERDALREAREDSASVAQKEAALEEALTDKEIQKMREAGATQEEIDEEVANHQKKLLDWINDSYDLQLSRQMDAVREAGESQLETLDIMIGRWQLLIDKAIEYTQVVGMVHMTEPQLFIPAPLNWGEYFTKEGLPNYGGEVIPKLGAGGIVTKPTLALLGEEGPEVVSPLTGGSSLVGGITNIFNIPNMIVREEADINRIARELYKLQKVKSRGVGVT